MDQVVEVVTPRCWEAERSERLARCHLAMNSCGSMRVRLAKGQTE
jgi:hypothetical protein